jgi:hypothetical protein
MASYPPIVILYGVIIQDAIRTGDVEAMRQLESDAQRYVDSVDEVKSALEDLRNEIRRRSDS